jgi:ATP-binding cassette subfamily F protein uup
MDRLVDHLFVFEGDGVINDFPGNYSQYRESLKEKEELQVPGYKSQEKKNENTATGHLKPATGNMEPATSNKRKAGFKEKREFEMLEKEISDLATEKEMITQKLSDSNTSFEELQRLSVRIGEVSSQLDEKELRWLELSEII